MKKSFIQNILLLLLCVLVIELFSMVAIESFNYTQLWHSYPTYLYWGKTQKEVYDPLGPHFVDTDEVKWATWHQKNSTIRHKGQCYDVLMKFNEIGARGPLPDSTDHHNVIFLGDSFIEGFGLGEEESITEQYSIMTSRPVLNLGGGGSFGTTQMAMIYDSLGSVFRHEKVILCLYLDNDFIDDDINRYYESRYRPYLVENNGSGEYELVYKDALSQSLAKDGSYKKGQTVERVKKYSIPDFLTLNKLSIFQKIGALGYTPRLFMEMKYRLEAKGIKPNEVDFDEKREKLLKYNIDRISQMAKRNNAELVILNIPSKQFLFSLGGHPEYKEQVDGLLRQFVDDNTTYVDLTQSFLNEKGDYLKYYFNCDLHFNPDGAKKVAALLAENDMLDNQMVTKD